MNTDRFENEYPGLSTISVILKVIGIVVIILASISLIYGLTLLGGSTDERIIGIYLIIYASVSGLLFSVPFFAFAELIKVLVRIEFNTRKKSVDEIIEPFENYRQHHEFSGSGKNERSFEEWKKDNPHKTLNDYYATIRK